MILYLDTSALIKIYVREPGREVVEVAVEGSSRIATAMVSYAEARATFARLLREESLTEEEHARVVEALNNRWRTYEKPSVTENLVRLAGDFAQRFALRGYDSIQLASAFVSHGRHADLSFLAFDNDLNDAARQVVRLYSARREKDAEDDTET